jgi:hypothetical protein
MHPCCFQRDQVFHFGVDYHTTGFLTLELDWCPLRAVFDMYIGSDLSAPCLCTV